MTMTAKQQVSQKEFEKQVEIESANLQHFNYMNKTQADKVAKETVNQLYEVTG